MEFRQDIFVPGKAVLGGIILNGANSVKITTVINTDSDRVLEDPFIYTVNPTDNFLDVMQTKETGNPVSSTQVDIVMPYEGDNVGRFLWISDGGDYAGINNIRVLEEDAETVLFTINANSAVTLLFCTGTAWIQLYVTP